MDHQEQSVNLVVFKPKKNMNLIIEDSRIIKPYYYESNTTPSSLKNYIPLTVFDKVTFDSQVACIIAYHSPTPPNASLEQGLRKALSIFRPYAGRLSVDKNGDPIIVLNDEGVKFIEASVDGPLDEWVPFEQSPNLLRLHPSTEGVDEVFQVQLTRFSCGSLVVGFVSHHLVADAVSANMLLVAWGQATRGVDINPVPSFDRHKVFTPRDFPQFDQFEHRGVEYMSKKLKKNPSENGILEEILVHQVRYTRGFLAKLKTIASSQVDEERPYSTFESLLGHVWRTITKARGLDEDETTNVKISINGRMRLTPKKPNYFGNLILWAFPTSTVKDLTTKPLSHATKLIRDAIAKVNDDYFKSFIDFASYKVEEEDLIPTTDISKVVYTPNVFVDSWLRNPTYEIDFGTGFPFAFTPSYMPTDGAIYLLPISPEDGSVDVVVSLFKDRLEKFKEICYSLDVGPSIILISSI